MTRRLTYLMGLMMVALFLAACGGGDEPDPEPVAPATSPPRATEDPISASVNQTVAAIAVAETVAALTGGATATPESATTVPTATEAVVEETAVVATATDQPPTVEPTPTTPADETQETNAEPPSCRTVTGVNVRSGPGTVYNPPVGTLAANTALIPLSYVPRGFPQGEWLEVEVESTGQVVWVTAGAQFVSCNVSVASLPAPANILPTPRPTATPTPIPPTATPTRVVAGLPPNVANDVPGGACERTDHIISTIQVDPNFLYRVFARDDRAGNNDGDGIELVRFTISDNFGTLYQREERVAGYCIFQGGEPACRPWPFNELGQYTWGNGGPVVVPGTYQVFIEVVSQEPDPSTESNVCNWNFDMDVTLP